MKTLLAAAVAVMILLGGSRDALAQSGERRREPAVWWGLMTDTPLRRDWSLFLDTHYNSRAFVVARGGLTWRAKAGPAFTAGYAHLWTDPGTGFLTRDEHRPWAQAFLPFGFADDWTLSQRFRAELRFQERVDQGKTVPGFTRTPRLRSQTAVSYWLPRRGALRFFLQSALEILINGGKEAGPNYLDQSRVSLMLGYRKKPFTVRWGYMRRFIPTKSGVIPIVEHNAVFWVNWKGRAPGAQVLEVPEGGNP